MSSSPRVWCAGDQQWHAADDKWQYLDRAGTTGTGEEQRKAQLVRQVCNHGDATTPIAAAAAAAATILSAVAPAAPADDGKAARPKMPGHGSYRHFIFWALHRIGRGERETVVDYVSRLSGGRCSRAEIVTSLGREKGLAVPLWSQDDKHYELTEEGHAMMADSGEGGPPEPPAVPSPSTTTAAGTAPSATVSPNLPPPNAPPPNAPPPNAAPPVGWVWPRIFETIEVEVQPDESRPAYWTPARVTGACALRP